MYYVHTINNVNLPFFFLLGPFVFTNVVTCNTSGSKVFSTDIVRISKFFGSHFIVNVPKSPIVPMINTNWMCCFHVKETNFVYCVYQCTGDQFDIYLCGLLPIANNVFTKIWTISIQFIRQSMHKHSLYANIMDLHWNQRLVMDKFRKNSGEIYVWVGRFSCIKTLDWTYLICIQYGGRCSRLSKWCGPMATRKRNIYCGRMTASRATNHVFILDSNYMCELPAGIVIS